MKNPFRHAEEVLAEAVREEEGTRLGAVRAEACDPFQETLEENLVEVAFAEAADYDDIHKAILNEHLRHCAAA